MRGAVAQFFRAGDRRGFHGGGRADAKRIDADRVGDVLKLRRAKIDYSEIESCFHLAIGVLKRFELAKSAMRSQAGP